MTCRSRHVNPYFLRENTCSFPMSTPTTSSSKTPAASATASAVVASMATTAAASATTATDIASTAMSTSTATESRLSVAGYHSRWHEKHAIRNRQAISLLSRLAWASTLRVEREFPSTMEVKSRRENSKETRIPCLRATLTAMWVCVVHVRTTRTTRTLRARSARTAAVEHRSLPLEP
nr:hypothetical protein KRP22_14172 [Phytophthora ramorum]